jgi:sarcosine oxidase
MLAGEAYADWALLEGDGGEQLVTATGGLDFFPPGAAIPAIDYTSSLAACGVPFDELDVAGVNRRWPAFSLPDGTVSIYQKDTSIVPAGRSTATMQRLARRHGARLHDQSPVVGLVDHGDEVEVTIGRAAGHRTVRARRVVLTADAWTNDLLGYLDTALDDPSFYGFPTYQEGGHGALVKAAQDCGGAETTAATRSFDTDPVALDRLSGFMSGLLPGVGPPAHTVTCLYTLTPDRDFVVDAVPGHPSIFVGLGAAHAFKFAPTFGRLLADLATTGTTISDIGAFAMDRRALVDVDFEPTWLV